VLILRLVSLFSVILLFMPEPVLAEGILDQIGWRDSVKKDPTFVIVLGAIIITIFFLAYRAWLDMREKSEQRKIRQEEEEILTVGVVTKPFKFEGRSLRQRSGSLLLLLFQRSQAQRRYRFLRPCLPR